jgi:2-polyprenyl-6-methoxyphenol hydroxylase-like FAD-dependent oxidoreductase
MREARTEVLVVGAGPVGLWTALLLAEAGIEVSIIDREARTAARSYACGIHPRTLQSLANAGVADAVLERGRRIHRVALWDRKSFQAELKFSELNPTYPFLLILPQNILESLLEQRLHKAGVSVHWNHRFASFVDEEECVAATIEELAGTGTGYIVPHWEMVVKNRAQLRAQYLIGADGYSSLVRQVAGLNYQRVGDPEFFAAFEFESSEPVDDEVRVVLDETTDVLWPLPEGKCRWTFQLLRHELPAEFPEKERRAVRLAQPQVDERIRQYVEKVGHQRAPWFSAQVKTISWCSEVTFERRLAKPAGLNRCWLVGDAAHQTGPVGIQSMNSGFAEAEALVSRLKRIFRQESRPEILDAYNKEHQERWNKLMGITGGLKERSDTSDWVRASCAKLMPCLPGLDADLTSLASQLKLDLS